MMSKSQKVAVPHALGRKVNVLEKLDKIRSSKKQLRELIFILGLKGIHKTNKNLQIIISTT